jgi:hypothetical protein
VVSVEAIQLCVLNSSRLLEDSGKVSAPSAAALAELSIEEISKAWLLYFVWLIGTGREQSRVSFKFTAKERDTIGQFFEKNRAYLDSLIDEVPLAFKDHPPKLRFLRFLMDYMQFVTPILLARKEYLAQVTEVALGPVFNARELLGETTLQSNPSVYQGFKRRGLSELAKVKNRGFYVDLTRSNEFIAPDMNVPVVPLLQGLSARLILALKFELLSLTT